jgi:chromosome segregation protein
MEGVTQGLSQITLREREIALELEHLVAGIRERHGTELQEEVHRYHLLPSLSEEAEQELKELRAQVEKMGEINLTAIDEHAELANRSEFLLTQKKDLQESMDKLQEAIRRIDATSRERFKQTFDIVNEKFQAIFPRLFGGGRASLVLTQEGQGTEPGVEIVAQPPGKKLQSMNLLSGGEKALTAVALIFAIFLIKPTPFCLLDEVDAPLDEGNVGRYNDMVKEMSKQSQFILITHNKRTMEVADTLYGVTMEEPGISKLVSVKLREAKAANDNITAA